MDLMIGKIDLRFWIVAATSALVPAFLCPMPASANEPLELKLFCSSKCHQAFEQTVAGYVTKRYAEEEERTGAQPARKKIQIVVDYYFPGGDSTNIFYLDKTQYDFTILYEKVVKKNRPGCWRVKKYDGAAETIYVANFAFATFTELSSNDRNCLHLMVVDSIAQ
jgi:hypothetical protein